MIRTSGYNPCSPVENHKSMHGGRNRSAPNKSTCKSSDSVRHRHSGPYRRRCPEQVADVEGLRRRRQQEEKQQRTPGEGENGCHPLVFVCASRRVWCAGKKWIGRLAEREIFGLFPVAGGRRPAGLFIQAWSGWTCVCEEAEHVLGEDMDSGSCVLGPWKFRPRILLGQDHTNVMVTWAALEAKLYGNSTCIHLS